MIVEYIRYRTGQERAKEFETAYASAQTALAASPHCLRSEVARCVDEPGAYLVRIEWDPREGHLQGFRTSPEIRTFFADVRPFVDDIEEMRHYEPTPIRGDQP